MELLKERRKRLLAPTTFGEQTRKPQSCFFPDYKTGSLAAKFIPGLPPLIQPYNFRCRNVFVDLVRDADFSKKVLPSIKTRTIRKNSSIDYETMQFTNDHGLRINTTMSCDTENSSRTGSLFNDSGSSFDDDRNQLDSDYECSSPPSNINSDIISITRKIDALTSCDGFHSTDSGIDDWESDHGKRNNFDQRYVSTIPSTIMTISTLTEPPLSDHTPSNFVFPISTLLQKSVRGRQSPSEHSNDSGIHYDDAKQSWSADDLGTSGCSTMFDKANKPLISQAFSNWSSLRGGNRTLNKIAYRDSRRVFDLQSFVLESRKRNENFRNEHQRLSFLPLDHKGEQKITVMPQTLHFEKYLMEENYRNVGKETEENKSVEKRTWFSSMNSTNVFEWFFPTTSINEWRLQISQYFTKGRQSTYGELGDHKQNVEERIEENKEFSDEMIRSHNSFRQRHGCNDLSPAEDLSKDAQMWADIIAEKGFLQYSELPGRGENIVFLDTNGLDPTGSEVTKVWYGQQKFHDYSSPRWRKDTLNFTQVVWKSSSEIGIGVAKIKGHDKMVVVAQYRPAGNGNMPGEFRKNVPPPKQ